MINWYFANQVVKHQKSLYERKEFHEISYQVDWLPRFITKNLPFFLKYFQKASNFHGIVVFSQLPRYEVPRFLSKINLGSSVFNQLTKYEY